MFPAPGSELTYEWKLPPRRSWWWANLSSVFSHKDESLLTSIPHICQFPDVATKQRKVRQNNINCTHYFAPYYRFSSQFSCGEIVPHDNMSCGQFVHICYVNKFCVFLLYFFPSKNYDLLHLGQAWGSEDLVNGEQDLTSSEIFSRKAPQIIVCTIVSWWIITTIFRLCGRDPEMQLSVQFPVRRAPLLLSGPAMILLIIIFLNVIFFKNSHTHQRAPLLLSGTWSSLIWSWW